MSLLLRSLCVLTPLVLAITGFRSQILADWWLENLVVFVFLFVLWSSRRRVPLSNASYLLLFVFLCAHEYGALYSYSNVPLGELAKLYLHTDRNHYDRLVHFLFGLLIIYPAYEACLILTKLRGWLSYALPVQFILGSSAIYEILEWLVAIQVDPALGTEFIGAQGDPWDSPEDMAAAAIGCLIAVPIIMIALRSASIPNRRA